MLVFLSSVVCVSTCFGCTSSLSPFLLLPTNLLVYNALSSPTSLFLFFFFSDLLYLPLIVHCYMNAVSPYW